MRLLVTGAGSGIGRATATELARRGHEVIATARDVTTLAELDVASRRHLDVAEQASVDEIHREVGWVDGIVNNAAFSVGGPIEHVSLRHVQRMFETNVLGPVRVIQAFLPGMRERRSGVIVNISSVAGHVAEPLGGFYSATKHALEAISEALYLEVRHFGVRVVIIEPGFIAPGMKPHPDSGHPAVYDELAEQLHGLEGSVLGGPRPGPEVVGNVIADAVDSPDGPVRRPVGADAELILSTRAALGDEEFEAAMRQVIGLTW
jgi:NAD(P)-dependent dehydrogenase (short-subunit alcohol dehydrogenase family)